MSAVGRFVVEFRKNNLRRTDLGDGEVSGTPCATCWMPPAGRSIDLILEPKASGSCFVSEVRRSGELARESRARDLLINDPTLIATDDAKVFTTCVVGSSWKARTREARGRKALIVRTRDGAFAHGQQSFGALTFSDQTPKIRLRR